MLLAALGCNLAWGIIDGAVFLMARFNERGHHHATRAAREGSGAAHGLIADALPPLLASVLPREQLEVMRQGLLQLPEPEGPRLTRRDWLGSIGICLLSFFSTFPIVIPFMLIGDARLALRVSNAVAIAMLLACGYVLGQYAVSALGRGACAGRARLRTRRRGDRAWRVTMVDPRLAWSRTARQRGTASANAQ